MNRKQAKQEVMTKLSFRYIWVCHACGCSQSYGCAHYHTRARLTRMPISDHKIWRGGMLE